MNIFNSLGSNYSWRFVARSLFVPGSKQALNQLQSTLSTHYSGQAALTYKGREALEQALHWSGLPAGSAVGINGFTCYVVYRAVERAGYRPVFIDVSPRQLNFGLPALQQAYKTAENLRAVIIQNTLGYPADISALLAFCRKHDLLVIEDLAHSLGAVYDNGQEAGTIGDLTMLSFSQDKPLDAVAGGAVIDRRLKKTHKKLQLLPVSWWKRELNRDYPFWTSIIRGTYPLGLGRIMHFVLKKVHFLATPMGDAGVGIHAMSGATAAQIVFRWEQKDALLAHRREIAAIYQKQLPQLLQFAQVYGNPSVLRFPLWVDDRKSLVRYLAKHDIHIGDTWYDAPIAPRRYLADTTYSEGLCPHGDDLARHIVNLPTHIHVTPVVAEAICAKIKQWHALQAKT